MFCSSRIFPGHAYDWQSSSVLLSISLRPMSHRRSGFRLTCVGRNVTRPCYEPTQTGTAPAWEEIGLLTDGSSLTGSRKSSPWSAQNHGLDLAMSLANTTRVLESSPYAHTASAAFAQHPPHG